MTIKRVEFFDAMESVYDENEGPFLSFDDPIDVLTDDDSYVVRIKNEDGSITTNFVSKKFLSMIKVTAVEDSDDEEAGEQEDGT